MKSPDQSQRFLFDKHPIRGQYVSLDASWTRIVEQSGLEGRALLLLGEALAAMVLLVDTLKIKGSVILQVRGSGPLGLLVVEASSENQIRGVARQTSEITDEMDLPEIFGSSYFVITIKTEGAEPHQGIASLCEEQILQKLSNTISQPPISWRLVSGLRATKRLLAVCFCRNCQANQRMKTRGIGSVC